MQGVDFGWDYQFLPAPVATPTDEAPTPTSGTSGCIDRVAFVQDVTIPDNTLLQGGQEFEKIWRLRNSGTCAWNSSYSIVFASGDSMSGLAAVALPVQVTPAEAGMSCKQAAKVKFAGDRKARHAYKKACKEAHKA